MDAAGSLALVVLGMIIGWVLQLVIDFLILRPHWIAQGRQQASTVPDEELRAALREQTAALTRLEALRGEETAALARLNAHLAELAGRAEPAVSDEMLQNALARITAALEAQHEAAQRDRLTDINGIGPAYAGRLHEMGIHTFKQLAALTPDELATMMNVRGRPKIDAASWIEQARLYVSGLAKTEEAT